MHLKLSSVKSRPSCPGEDELMLEMFIDNGNVSLWPEGVGWWKYILGYLGGYVLKLIHPIFMYFESYCNKISKKDVSFLVWFYLKWTSIVEYAHSPYKYHNVCINTYRQLHDIISPKRPTHSPRPEAWFGNTQSAFLMTFSSVYQITVMILWHDTYFTELVNLPSRG